MKRPLLFVCISLLAASHVIRGRLRFGAKSAGAVRDPTTTQSTVRPKQLRCSCRGSQQFHRRPGQIEDRGGRLHQRHRIEEGRQRRLARPGQQRRIDHRRQRRFPGQRQFGQVTSNKDTTMTVTISRLYDKYTDAQRAVRRSRGRRRAAFGHQHRRQQFGQLVQRRQEGGSRPRRRRRSRRRRRQGRRHRCRRGRRRRPSCRPWLARDPGPWARLLPRAGWPRRRSALPPAPRRAGLSAR